MSVMPSRSRPKTTPPLQRRRGVVEVHDRLLGAADRLVGALDQLLAGLGQHLDRDVVGDQVLLDELPDEVEVGLAGRREADLDLLVAHAHQQVEHPPLALGAHRVDQGLVAVAQVDGAPARGLGHALGRPGAVRQVDRGAGLCWGMGWGGHDGLLLSRCEWVWTWKTGCGHNDQGETRVNSATGCRPKRPRRGDEEEASATCREATLRHPCAKDRSAPAYSLAAQPAGWGRARG